MIGKVKWFNDAKGMGIIVDAFEGREALVLYKQIQSPGFKTLEAGEQVTFDLVEGPKGPEAHNVHRSR